MEDLPGFKDIAPHLTHPLVLVGFVLLAVFGLQRTLLKSGHLPPLTRRDGTGIVRSLMRYGFVIAILIIVLGFSLASYQTAQEPNSPPPTSTQKQEAIAQDGSTAIDAGRDVTMSTQGTTPKSNP